MSGVILQVEFLIKLQSQLLPYIPVFLIEPGECICDPIVESRKLLIVLGADHVSTTSSNSVTFKGTEREDILVSLQLVEVDCLFDHLLEFGDIFIEHL